MGILLFIMYFGIPPFKNNDPQQIAQDHYSLNLFKYMTSGHPKAMRIFLENHPFLSNFVK